MANKLAQKLCIFMYFSPKITRTWQAISRNYCGFGR
jgi:hypothetical protein